MEKPHGLILAGGEGRRFGGAQKALIELGGETLLQRAIARLGPQCGCLALSANGDPALYSKSRLPVLRDGQSDTQSGAQGPLAGILAGLEWAAREGASLLFTAPVDTPFLPDGLVEHLMLETGANRFAVAASRVEGAVRMHPVVGLWPVALADDLRKALENGERRVGKFVRDNGAAIVDMSDQSPIDPFFNINTPDDLARAQGYLR